MSSLACPNKTWITLISVFCSDCVCISGGNGGTGTTDLKSFAALASRSSPHRSLPVHRRDSGACPDTRRFNTLYEITYSILLVFPDSMCLCKPNSIEPPWYGPVCPVVWELRLESALKSAVCDDGRGKA